MFKENESLKVGKIYEIFQFFLKVISRDICNEIKYYQSEKGLNDDSKKIMEECFKKEKFQIKRKDLAYAVRIFISLILLPEQDKENKIKNNNNNVIGYLKAQDFWPKEIYINPDFDNALNKLRLINAKVCQIISFYEALGMDIKDDEFEDIKKAIENEKKARKEEDEENSDSENKKNGDDTSESGGDDDDNGGDDDDVRDD